MLIGSTPRKMKTRSSTTIWSPIFMPQMEAHGRACSQLSFVETRHARHRSNESFERALGAIDNGAPGPPPSFTRSEGAHGPAGSALADEPKSDTVPLKRQPAEHVQLLLARLAGV